jgi:arabinofuranosyltransferase
MFSLLYYGSVVPNTAYAKLSAGFPRRVFVERGLDYLAVLARYDALSALAIAAAIAALALQRTAAAGWLAASLASQIAYVVWVGGDYMQGRFVSFVTLLSITLLARLAIRPAYPAWLRPALALALSVYALAYPRTPLTTPLAQVKEDSAVHAPGREFVMDARGTLGVYTSLYSYLTASDRAEYPEHPLAIEGRKFARSDRKVAVIHAAGMFGWAAGKSKIIIEAHGIADPLLARIPASVFAGVGHYLRYRPEGYVDGLTMGHVQLEDPDLNAYYAKIALITQSPQLFTLERLKTIALLNLGAYDSLLEHFVAAKIRGKVALPNATRAFKSP